MGILYTEPREESEATYIPKGSEYVPVLERPSTERWLYDRINPYYQKFMNYSHGMMAQNDVYRLGLVLQKMAKELEESRKPPSNIMLPYVPRPSMFRMKTIEESK